MARKIAMAVAAVAVVVAAMLVSTAAAADDVIHLTSKSFKADVLKSDEVWLVEFYAPWCGHCKNLAPEWAKAATALKGIVNVAAVDATQEQSLASKYNVQGFPTIKVFGLDKRNPTDYQGARQAKAIAEAGLKAAKSVVKARLSGKKSGSKSSSSSSSGSKKRRTNSNSDDAVITLTDDNFDDLIMNSKDMWLVEFYAPWCGHCKNLAPEWKAAAEELKGNVKVAALDATANEQIASRYGIRGFPTIKVFPPGKKSKMGAEDYQGGRMASAITSYALSKLDEYGIEPEVTELTGQDVWDENCGNKRICIVTVLPHILDSGASGRNAYLDTVKAVVKRKAKLGFKFLWTSAGQQAELEKSLGMEFGFPAVAAINLGKERYAVHAGAFSESALGSFCERLMSGRAKTTALAVPKIATAEPWDGKDGVLAVEDDDDDDLMAELMAEL